MSSEILAVLEYMEKEKGISREDMIATIESAIKTAAERGVNTSGDVRVEISAKTGAMKYTWIKLGYMPTAQRWEILLSVSLIHHI